MEIKLNINKAKVAQARVKQMATATLWKSGNFTELLLNDYQREMRDKFDKSDSILFTLLSSRRIGKTWVEGAIALRQCMTRPNSRVLFLSTTTEQVEEICDQTFTLLLETCPEDIKPVYHKKSHKYRFKNGSEIRVKGLDKTGGDAIRGVKAHLVIFDEFCFMKDIVNIIDSVVMPMVIGTGGRILLGSTPPSTPGHESVGIIRKCEMTDSIAKFTIDAALDVLYTQKQIDMFLSEAGGRDSTVCRREYFCEIATEADLAVFPALSDSKMKTIVVNTPKPTYPIDRYVSMDIGMRDMTVILFGYWDYPRATLVIEDEIVFDKNKADTGSVAEAIKKKERELWGANAPKKRVCDTDPRMIADLHKISNIKFIATKKDKKHAQVNQTNIMFLNNEIEISPKCVTLIDHCRYGVWKENFLEYQRTKAMGHFDAIDALVYMVRNISRSSNPIPNQDYSVYNYANHDAYEEKPVKNTLGRLFLRRR